MQVFNQCGTLAMKSCLVRSASLSLIISDNGMTMLKVKGSQRAASVNTDQKVGMTLRALLLLSQPG